jgi:hypothetical protein
MASIWHWASGGLPDAGMRSLLPENPGQLGSGAPSVTMHDAELAESRGQVSFCRTTLESGFAGTVRIFVGNSHEAWFLRDAHMVASVEKSMFAFLLELSWHEEK